MERHKAQGCCCLVVQRRILQVSAPLEQLLTELEDFLRILDQESLSSAAAERKSGLAERLRLYIKSSGSDEEYIYMNKVTVHRPQNAESQDKAPEEQSPLANGEARQHATAPQKSLPDLPPPKTIPERKQPSVPKIDSPEGYYEEAEPYDVSINEDGEAVSSSYESYDEEEGGRGRAAPYQWPSPEASIELMRDARICAFLWRKKWLGQWAKQLCVIRDTRLLCYKSSKDHSPQLDVNLLGSSVVHKEKQVRKKEHKLKITPMNADVIVLGLQSKDQAEQWLRVIQEVSGLPPDGAAEGNQYSPEAQRLSSQKADLAEKYLSASEYGSSVDGHPEVPETKDVKKKSSAGLRLSNLMNLGRKKSTSLEPAERSLETANYLNVLVNSQWKSRWCSVRDSHLHFYQDRNRSKVAQQPLSLVGCEVVPDPSPDHLYSFRILHSGEELAKLEAKSSEEMGHWLGLLLSESGSKTDPEEFTYDYVDADRVSCIVSAARNSLLLMQRKFSEPNTYIDGLPSQDRPDLLYDDVEMSELAAAADPEEAAPAADAPSELDPDRMYLDLTPVKSFLHSPGGTRGCSPMPPCPDPPADALPAEPGPAPAQPPDAAIATSAEPPELSQQQGGPEQGELSPRISAVRIQAEQQKLSFPSSCPDAVAVAPAGAGPPAKDRLRVTSADQTRQEQDGGGGEAVLRGEGEAGEEEGGDPGAPGPAPEGEAGAEGDAVEMHGQGGAGQPGAEAEGDRGGVQGGGEAARGPGAPHRGGEGQPEEGRGRARDAGHHRGHLPPGHREPPTQSHRRPRPCPRLDPSQLCHGAQEQTALRHGHGQRHRPPESQGMGEERDQLGHTSHGKPLPPTRTSATSPLRRPGLP